MGNAFGFGDANVAVEHESFCGRMCNSLCGVVVGVVLVPVAIILLGWNEFNFVRNEAVFQYVQDKVVDVPCQPPSWSGDESKPVWTSCPVTQLYDFSKDASLSGFPIFTTGLQGAWFQASSTIYQWKESKSCSDQKTVGGGKTKICQYSYSKNWQTEPIDSNTFYCYPTCRKGCIDSCGVQISNKHSIIPEALQKRYDAPENAVTIGDKSLHPNDQYGLNRGLLAAFEDSVSPSLKDSQSSCNVFPGRYVASFGDGVVGFMQRADGTTQIGDVKTRFALSRVTLDATSLSVIAVLKHYGSTGAWGFLPWNTGKSGTMANVNWATVGEISESGMIDEKKSENNDLVWILRFGGFFLMFIGLQLITGPIALAPEIIPCVGDLIGEVVGCALCCMNFAFSIMLSLLVIGIAWVLARPLIGGIILAIALLAGAAVFFTRQKFRKSGGRGARSPQMVQPLNEVMPGDLPMAAPVHMPQMMVVTCPEGVGPGQLVQVIVPDGRVCNVPVPPGTYPGQQFEVQV